jgi:hypothetical protein
MAEYFILHDGPHGSCRASGRHSHGDEFNVWFNTLSDKQRAYFRDQANKQQRSVMAVASCDWPHPHPDHPCGREVRVGVTRCSVCGNVDGSPECFAAGCWEDATQADVDALVVEAMERRL